MRDVAFWPIATCASETHVGRIQGTADVAGPAAVPPPSRLTHSGSGVCIAAVGDCGPESKVHATRNTFDTPPSARGWSERLMRLRPSVLAS
jgi:hypothetical protein